MSSVLDPWTYLNVLFRPTHPRPDPNGRSVSTKEEKKKNGQLREIGLVRMTYGGKVISASSNPTNDLPSLISFVNY